MIIQKIISSPCRGTSEWSQRLQSQCPSATCDPKARSSQGRECWRRFDDHDDDVDYVDHHHHHYLRCHCTVQNTMRYIISTWGHKRTHWLWRSACDVGWGLLDFSCKQILSKSLPPCSFSSVLCHPTDLQNYKSHQHLHVAGDEVSLILLQTDLVNIFIIIIPSQSSSSLSLK